VSDINLPGLSGFDFLKSLRKSGNQIPFIALTARNERMDVTEGLREGADDYVTKPFGLEELVLRIKAVLRRSGAISDNRTFMLGNVLLDYENHTVKCDEVELDISPTEFNLLQVLMENKDKVVRKQVLMREVWGFDFETNTSVLDTYISYLRKKLPDNSNVQIKTVRGVGFKIEELR
jgi:two-component system OmpR family response regulator